MWGFGIYFAKDAWYSDHGYAYSNSSKRYLMLVKVSLGECKHRSSDNSLKRPDKKDNPKFAYNSHSGDHHAS